MSKNYYPGYSVRPDQGTPSGSGYLKWLESMQTIKKAEEFSAATGLPVITAEQKPKGPPAQGPGYGQLRMDQHTENKPKEKPQWYMERVDFEDLPRLKGQEVFLISVSRPIVWKQECNHLNLEMQTVADVSTRSYNGCTLLCATGEVRHFQRSYWDNLPGEYVLPYVRVLPGVTLKLLDFLELGKLIPGSKLAIMGRPAGRAAPRYTTTESKNIGVVSSIDMVNGIVKVALEAGVIIAFSPDLWSMSSVASLPYAPCVARVQYMTAAEELAKQMDKKILDSLRNNKATEHKIKESEDAPDEGAEAYLPTFSWEYQSPKKEKFMSVMKELGNIFIEGVKIHSSGDVARKIVEIVKGQLKENYPKMLSDNDLGKALAPVLIPALIYVVAKNYFEENPTMEKAADVSEYALLGASKDLVEYANKLLPLFSSVAALTTLLETNDED
jgi:hypothetical protein